MYIPMIILLTIVLPVGQAVWQWMDHSRTPFLVFMEPPAIDRRILNQFALSESGGYLRVATTSQPPWKQGDVAPGQRPILRIGGGLAGEGLQHVIMEQAVGGAGNFGMIELPQNPIAKSFDIRPMPAKPFVAVGQPLPDFIDEEGCETVAVVLKGQRGIRSVDDAAPVRRERFTVVLE